MPNSQFIPLLQERRSELMQVVNAIDNILQFHDAVPGPTDSDSKKLSGKRKPSAGGRRSAIDPVDKDSLYAQFGANIPTPDIVGHFKNKYTKEQIYQAKWYWKKNRGKEI